MHLLTIRLSKFVFFVSIISESIAMTNVRGIVLWALIQ